MSVGYMQGENRIPEEVRRRIAYEDDRCAFVVDDSQHTHPLSVCVCVHPEINYSTMTVTAYFTMRLRSVFPRGLDTSRFASSVARAERQRYMLFAAESVSNSIQSVTDRLLRQRIDIGLAQQEVANVCEVRLPKDGVESQIMTQVALRTAFDGYNDCDIITSVQFLVSCHEEYNHMNIKIAQLMSARAYAVAHKLLSPIVEGESAEIKAAFRKEALQEFHTSKSGLRGERLNDLSCALHVEQVQDAADYEPKYPTVEEFASSGQVGDVAELGSELSALLQEGSGDGILKIADDVNALCSARSALLDSRDMTMIETRKKTR